MKNTRLVILSTVFALLGSSTLVFGFTGPSHFKPSNTGRTVSSFPQLEPATYDVALAHNQGLEVEVVTFTENGFDPALITRPRGPFILALHNRSGEKELVFRISRAQAEQFYEVRVSSGRRNQHQRLDLTPGSYHISEVNHPAWRCALTITR